MQRKKVRKTSRTQIAHFLSKNKDNVLYSKSRLNSANKILYFYYDLVIHSITGHAVLLCVTNKAQTCR